MSLDEEIKALQQGNTAGWQNIVDLYRERIFAFLSRFTHDRWELEDISQEVWIRLYTKISLYDFRYPFYTWVLKVTTNVAINYKRKRRWWERLSSDIPQKKSLDRCEFLDEIHKPLSLLSKKARVIFLLYHYESYSAQEIADILDIPTGTVKSSLSRSSKLLQNFFGGKTQWIVAKQKVSGLIISTAKCAKNNRQNSMNIQHSAIIVVKIWSQRNGYLHYANTKQ